MKVFIKTLVISCLAVVSLNLHAQLERPYVPPSPNASALVKFANIEVGHYSGVPNTSIPLGVMNGKNISIPVSLDYHASGIKVQDVAGSAGLGWSLNAGGAITRVVRGIPDGIKSNCPGGPSSFWSNINEFCDGERDVFYFSMLGRSGKMFLDGNGQPQTMPYQDIVIAPGPLTTGYWMITDEKGYTYYFGEHAAEKEQTTYFTGNTTYTQKYAYVSTWYLNRIVSPAGEQIATFTYTLGDDFEYLMYHEQGIVPSGGSLSRTIVNTKIQVNQPKYISSINTSLGSVVFDYFAYRYDLAGSWQLNAVTFKDFNATAIRKYSLSMGYFTGEFNAPNVRLKLLSISEGLQDQSIPYTFNYFDGDSSNPNRDNFKTDHFGYFNGSSNTCTTIYNRMPLGCGVSNGISKAPGDLLNMSLFSLKEIVTSNGGKVTFEYQQNAGCLRILAISNFSSSSLVAKSTFTYSVGATYATPVYSYTTYDGATVYTSTSFKDLFDLNGTSTGFGTVTETFLDGSKIVRDFTNFSDYNDFTPIVDKFLADPPASTPAYLGPQDVNGPPFSPFNTRFWMRGLPKATKIYDSQNNLLKEDNFLYQEGTNVSTVSNIVLHNYQQTGGTNPKITYLSGSYILNSVPVTLLQTKSYNYDQSNFSRSSVETLDYTYNSTLKTFPSAIITSTGSGGPQQKLTLRYPIDVVGTGSRPASPTEQADGIWSLISKHVITPVEKLSYLKDWDSNGFKIIGGELFTFKKGVPNGQPLIKEAYKLDLSAPITSLSTEATLVPSGGVTFSYDNSRYRLMKTFSYNESANILTEASDNQGVVSSYEYGYSNSLLTSSSKLIGSALKYKTQYSYNTVNGLLNTTDMNSLKTYYEYDNHGRLKLIKDNGQNIVSRYRYNSANQSEFLIDLFAINNNPASGQIPYTFTTTKSGETAGVTKYVWDFGDGQIVEGTSPSISHYYNAYGTYTVKLAKVNPEYGSIMTTKTITATASTPVQELTISINACSSINLCTTATCQLTSSISGGCTGTKTYVWEYSTDNGSTWNIVDSTSWRPPNPGSYQVRCTVGDNCSHSATSSTQTVNVTKTPAGCPEI